VEPGESGGVSLPGTLLSLAGSFLIGLTGFLLLPYPDSMNRGFILIISTLLGFSCSIIDSLLGASVQGIYINDGKLTERVYDSSGRRNVKIRGFSIINNSAVNFLSGASVLIIGLIVFLK